MADPDPLPRPLQDRALRTRQALLDAALECLVERGYAMTTTTEVARRAGVSRGAQLHHFPTKAQLLTASVGHLFQRRTAEFRKAFADAEPGADSLDAAIDLLWSMFNGPTFAAWLELWVAARHDPELRVAVLDIDRRFFEDSLDIFTELFPSSPGDATDPAASLGFTFAVLEGAALEALVPHDHAVSPDRHVDALKAIAQAFAPKEIP